MAEQDDPRPDGVAAAGDDACWMSRVCLECGLFAEQPPPTHCARCGAPVPAA